MVPHIFLYSRLMDPCILNNALCLSLQYIALYTHGYLVDVQPCTLVSMQICFPFLPHMNICLMACCIVSVAKQTSLLFAYPETW